MKTRETYIYYPDKYYELFNCIQDGIFVEQTPSIVDFGTAMINKRKHKCKKK